jgi:hypothetical protein
LSKDGGGINPAFSGMQRSTSNTRAEGAESQSQSVPLLEMEQLCRQNAAYRYNTEKQKIAVTGFEQFQSSYEMRGFTPLKERFVCAFDTEGQFLHLSMR